MKWMVIFKMDDDDTSLIVEFECNRDEVEEKTTQILSEVIGYDDSLFPFKDFEDHWSSINELKTRIFEYPKEILSVDPTVALKYCSEEREKQQATSEKVSKIHEILRTVKRFPETKEVLKEEYNKLIEETGYEEFNWKKM